MRSECTALMRPTCFSNCHMRQVSRSGPEVSDSTVELIDLRLHVLSSGSISYVRARRVLWQVLDSWMGPQQLVMALYGPVGIDDPSYWSSYPHVYPYELVPALEFLGLLRPPAQ